MFDNGLLYLESQRLRPTTSRLKPVWNRLNGQAKAQRYRVAKEREARLLSVRKLVSAGISQSVAVQRQDPPLHRSTYCHWSKRYSQYGFEGLIDCRLPEPPETIPDEIHEQICSLRRANREISVASIVSFVRHHHERKVSESSVKRILKRSGLHRRRGKPQSKNVLRGKPLVFGGMKLVEAAAVSTGYLQALTQTVVGHVQSLPVPESAGGPEIGDRDDKGRFLSSYNERYRKSEDDVVGPGFASVEDKRAQKDPSLFHVHGARPAVVERKLWALMCSPLIGTGQWDGMRTPRGQMLEELCGYAYMPSTLSLFTGELKYAGVSAALWETHACTWHAATQDWGGPRHAAVLYVDGTTKPIFTGYSSQSTHVSLLNRTMPGLDIVGFHTGYGVPLWYLGHSGRAPLVKAVPEAIRRLETQVGAEIARIVVIDAEGNSAPFLQGLDQEKRGWVTRLRPSMVQGKPVLNWSAFRSYREHDRIREGELDLRLDKGRMLRVRLLEIERSTSGKLVHLAVSKTLRIQDWPTVEMADLYFARWPNQELDFRAVNQATGFKQVRGYGKRLVDNVAVVTRLEKVQHMQMRAQQRYSKQSANLEKLQAQRDTQVQAESAAQQKKETIDAAIDAHINSPALERKQMQKLNQQRKKVEQSVISIQQKGQRTQATINKKKEMLQRCGDTVLRYEDEQQELIGKRQILAHDVELDSIFNVLKVGLTLLVTYVLKKMLDNARLTPATFLERIAILPARQYIIDGYEYITFEYNSRDPSIMALLIANSPAINALNLHTRGGNILRVAVEDPPKKNNQHDSS